MGFAQPLLRALSDEGYTTPTPIQTKAIPVLMEGHDLLGIAQTGTGKTAAFSLPILNALLADKGRPLPGTARALILAPTRELAAQIGENVRNYARHTRLSSAVIFGGVGYGPQMKALRGGLDILVATPGRLIDHLERGTVKLDKTTFVVLDEADHMLDLGFVVPIRKILARLPKERQSMFFSATMPKEIGALASEMLRNPKQVAVAPVATTAERVEQQVYLVDGAAKRGLLVELLGNPDFERTIVFTRTKRGADRVSATLDEAGITSAAIHGNKSQSQRQRALDDFKAGRTRVLVATDIAARGIDIDSVTHVINFELPEVPEQYVHRIGRTARAGASGAAIAFCDSSERGLLRDIERVTRQQIPTVDKRGQKGADVTPASELRSQGRGRPAGGRTNRPVMHEGERRHAGHQPHAGHREGERHFGGRKDGGGERHFSGRSEGGERSHAPRSEGPRAHAPRPEGARSHAPRPDSAHRGRPAGKRPHRKGQRPRFEANA